MLEGRQEGLSLSVDCQSCSDHRQSLAEVGRDLGESFGATPDAGTRR